MTLKIKTKTATYIANERVNTDNRGKNPACIVCETEIKKQQDHYIVRKITASRTVVVGMVCDQTCFSGIKMY